MSATAYHRGYCDALDYDCIHQDFNTEDEWDSYIEGYRDGVDANLFHDGGVCPDPSPKPYEELYHYDEMYADPHKFNDNWDDEFVNWGYRPEEGSVGY